MQNTSASSSVASAASAASEEAHLAVTGADPAGGISLSGRNRACARARALAGLVLTSGVVITLSSLDTTVSITNAQG
ncbi:hypothetical protein AB0N23_21075 [Streptomyces sp. NPDC052644]